MIDRDAHARRVGGHEAAADVGIVQQFEAGFQFLLRFGNFQNQALVGFAAVDKGAVNFMTTFLRQHRKQFASSLGEHKAHTGNRRHQTPLSKVIHLGSYTELLTWSKRLRTISRYVKTPKLRRKPDAREALRSCPL